MPIATRSMSKLKRTRDEMEEGSEKDDSNSSTTEEQRPRKKRKLTENAENNAPSIDKPKKEKKAKKTKKAKKVKKAKKTKASKKSTEKEDSSAIANKEMKRLKSKHRELLKKGFECVVGTDEAGRGPLAGPVVIAAAYVPIDICIIGITDSKAINEENEREKLYEIITSTKDIKYSVTVLDHEVIDEYNILESSMMGMRECVKKLHDQLIKQGSKGVDYALVDGNRDPLFIYPKELKYDYIIKGDGNIYCIAAASIIAKVVRDRLMHEYDKKWPQFKFAQNKGYPTPFHKQLVLSKGPCDIHRKSFRPVKDWYKKNKPEIHKKVEALKKQRAEERKKEKENMKNGKKKKGQKSITKFFGSTKKKKVIRKQEAEEQKELEIDDLLE